MSGRRGTVSQLDIDLRVGDRWRYVMVAHGDFEVAFHGEYRAIIPNERIVATEVYEGAPDSNGEGALITIAFSEVAGTTTLTILCDAGSREVRDLIINSGMEGGMQGGWICSRRSRAR